MSSAMIMEASLTQGSRELRSSTSGKEHDVACIRLACEATERKRSDEHDNSLTEISGPQFGLNDDEVGQKLEDASQEINFENRGLPPNDAAERSLSTEQATSTLKCDAEQAKLEIADEAVPEITELNTSLGKVEQSPVNVSENHDLKQLETPTANADNKPCQSGSMDGSISRKSAKRKSSVGSFPTSTRVLRSRSQDKSDAPKPVETGLNPEQSGLPVEDLTRKIDFEQQRTAAEDELISMQEQLGMVNEEAALCKSPDNPQETHTCNTTQIEEANLSEKSGGPGRKSSKIAAKGKHQLTASAENARVLRSRSQEKSKAPEPSNNAGIHTGANGEQKRTRKKKKRQNKHPVDEYSRIRKHLRYLLHQMATEQNFIDVYSGEGWKGQNLEKIKPEKELERARSKILSYKMRIRDLFQRLDSSIAEGRFPDTLYDSDGLIDSEDIYCAKCASKDLLDDNDIILCDGACERGFHQFCLDPPLLKEQIPSDEEGWLCPGCDCKVDCIDILNDALGTNLSISKTWEKVFPEAAAAVAGNKLDENFGLPSDDSDDDDYDPDCSDKDDKADADDKAQEEESSSDESDYSASEESDTVKKLQLSSDDSDDDDFDPDAPDDEEVKQESSGSDFTSDSEDLSVALDDSHKDEHISAAPDHTGTSNFIDNEKPKVGRKKKQSLPKEVLSVSEPGPDVLESAPVSDRRHVERLDYKKLYDDEYGNDATDSSDDEWFDAVDAPKKRKKNNPEEVASGSCDPTTQVRKDAADDSGVKHEKESGVQTPKKRSRKKAGSEAAHTAPAEGSSDPSSTRKRSQCKRLGEAVTQGLLKSFKEEQYPDKTRKEALVKELGITINQVNKWFENARWSFRHTSRMKARLDQCSPPSKETPTKSGENPTKSGENPTKSGENPTKSVEDPTKSGENPTESGENPTKSVEDPTKSGENATKSVENPTKSGENPTKSGSQDVAHNGVSTEEQQTNTNAGLSVKESLSGESSKQKPSTRNSRKRRSQGSPEEPDQSIEKAEPASVPIDTPNAATQDVRTSGRRKARKTAS